MKTENIERKLKESGFIVERNDDGFTTGNGDLFRIKVDLRNVAFSIQELSYAMMNWCNKYQLFGKRNGHFFYVDRIL